MKNRAYKNYIFDFYGTLVDILTDEKDPVLWDKLDYIKLMERLMKVMFLKRLMLSAWIRPVRS